MDRTHQTKNAAWRGPLTDPYMVVAILLVVTVSIPLAMPSLDSDFWTKEYPFYFDAPLLLLAAFALWKARVSAISRSAKRFWGYLAAGFLIWFSVRLSGPLHPGEYSSEVTLVLDLLYLAFYICLILALQLRPHKTSPDTSNDLIRQVESTGATLLVFGLLIYFIVIPAIYDPDSLLTAIPSITLYVALNLFLFARAISLRNSWRHPPWRDCYDWLVLATAGFVILDGLDLALRIAPDFGAAMNGTLFEALWLLPILGFIAAARRYSRDGSEKQSSISGENLEKLVWPRRGKLTYLALIPPLVHVTIELLDWSDELTRSPREVLVFFWILSAAGLSLLYDRRLRRQQQILVEQHLAINQQLEVAQRMDAISRMAGGLAHDFNNLLMVIQGFADLLSSDLDNKEHRRDANQISKAARKAGNLTKKLLTLGRKDKQGIRPFLPDEILQGMESTLQQLMGADQKLRMDLGETGYVLGDRDAFENAVLNLVLNARDASTSGGTIYLQTDNVLISEGGLLADTLGPGNYGVVTVRDEGKGMDEETRSHIFEPFFSKTQGGTGLGLSMVYSFAREAGGTIEVTSKIDEGTQFRLILPGGYPEDLIEPTESTTVSLNKQTITVLLVEDEESVRTVLKRSLQAAGVDVLEAESGEMALQALKKHMARIDLVVTDVVMPFMDGGTLARQIQAINDSLPIIFMTGYADGQLDRLGTLAETTPILKKPFDVKELLETIDRTLSKPKSRRFDT